MIRLETLRPDPLADGAPKHVVGALGLGRNADDVPGIAVAAGDVAALAAVILGEDAAKTLASGA